MGCCLRLAEHRQGARIPVKRAGEERAGSQVFLRARWQEQVRYPVRDPGCQEAGDPSASDRQIHSYACRAREALSLMLFPRVSTALCAAELLRRRLAVLAGLVGRGVAVGMHRTSPSGIMHGVSWSVGESGQEGEEMSERDGYEPGVPCWVATVHPDPEKAVCFYTELFGWEATDR